MVKVDLKTAKLLRREDWGWGGVGGVGTDGERRKKAACWRKERRLRNRVVLFSNPSSPTYCVTLGKALRAYVSSPVNRCGYATDIARGWPEVEKRCLPHSRLQEEPLDSGRSISERCLTSL